MSWYWWALIYAGCGAVMSTALAYYCGQEHTKKKHAGEISACKDSDCDQRGCIYFIALLLWPIALIGGGVKWWLETFEEGGKNAELPPLNEHPMPRKDEEVIEIRTPNGVHQLEAYKQQPDIVFVDEKCPNCAGHGAMAAHNVHGWSNCPVCAGTGKRAK
jgi:hypothetical protein